MCTDLGSGGHLLDSFLPSVPGALAASPAEGVDPVSGRGPLSLAYLMAGYRPREELDRGAWVMDVSGLGCRKSQKEECPEKHRRRRSKDYGHTMRP